MTWLIKIQECKSKGKKYRLFFPELPEALVKEIADVYHEKEREEQWVLLQRAMDKLGKTMERAKNWEPLSDPVLVAKIKEVFKPMMKNPMPQMRRDHLPPGSFRETDPESLRKKDE